MSEPVLRVLTYHRIVDPASGERCNPSLLSATPTGFETQMRHLARRYRVVGADEVAAAYRRERRLPDRAVLVTFDDAYRDVGEVAWPIMRALGLPATVFVPTAFMAGISGQFYKQFALTIAASTIISAFNSLTLSPALGALMLKAHKKDEHGHAHQAEALPPLGIAIIGGLICGGALTLYVIPAMYVALSRKRVAGGIVEEVPATAQA